MAAHSIGSRARGTRGAQPFTLDAAPEGTLVYAVQDESLGLHRMQAGVGSRGSPRGGGGTSERMSAAAKDGEPRHEVRNEGADGGTNLSAVVCLHTTALQMLCGASARALAPYETNRRGFSRSHTAGRGRQT